MANDIKEILREGTKDLLSEEILSEIETVFNTAVDEKASLNVEAALATMDDDHAAKVTALLEAIDGDHTKKLNQIVEAVTENHTNKLKRVVEKYQIIVNNEATEFKSQIVDSISNYLDLYLEKTFPADTLEEAVSNKRSSTVLSEMRKMLGVDLVLAKDQIREAIVDGKTQIDEARTQLVNVSGERDELEASLQQARSELVLDKLSAKLPPAKKNYIKKVLGDKDENFITENFDYTVQLFDKQTGQRNDKIKREAAKSVRGKVDVVVEQTQVRNEPPVQAEDRAPGIFDHYMGELGKY